MEYSKATISTLGKRHLRYEIPYIFPSKIKNKSVRYTWDLYNHDMYDMYQ